MDGGGYCSSDAVNLGEWEDCEGPCRDSFQGTSLICWLSHVARFRSNFIDIPFLGWKKHSCARVAHPMLFEGSNATIDVSAYDTIRVMGAVPVSGSNFYKLLSLNSHVLLYPGGVREALHRKVRLHWRQHALNLINMLPVLDVSFHCSSYFHFSKCRIRLLCECDAFKLVNGSSYLHHE